MSGLVTATITGEIPGTSFAAPVRFDYNPCDPYAVSLDCTAINVAAGEPYQEVVWTFARQVLVPGNVPDEDTDGIQDVMAHREGIYLCLHLSSPEGTGKLRFFAQAVLRFVQRTQVEVPIGGESKHMTAAIDAAVARLLDGVS